MCRLWTDSGGCHIHFNGYVIGSRRPQ
jgi:hypothetical protein